MMQDSKAPCLAPCFEKKMTFSMLRSTHRVEIPVSFTRIYSHLLDKVVSMTGPNGVTFSVEMTDYSRSDRRDIEFRYFLSHGWLEFAKDNGFQSGDCVTFSLKRNACFHVHVSSQLQKKHVIETPPLSRRCNKEGELGKEKRNDDKTKPLTEVSTTHQASTEREHKRASIKTSRRGIGREKLKKDVPVVKCRSLQKMDYVMHPGLHAAISSNSKFPQFVRKLTGLNYDIRMELPYPFAKEYGHRFEALVRLKGPSGRWRSVRLGVSVSAQNQIRVQCQQVSWRAFSLENQFKEGDVLLFSLVAYSKFVVKVFPLTP